MKRTLFLLFSFGIFSFAAQAVNHDPLYETIRAKIFPSKQAKFDPSRLTFGGNFGATFGSVTYVDISPLVGYRITDKFTAGIGLTYIYYRQKYTFSNGNTSIYQTNLYGGRLFSQYAIFPNIFIHGELEALNFDYYDFLTGDNTRAWFVSPIVGAGITQPIGQRGSFRIMALYALNSNNPKSPYYRNPFIFRVGFFL